MKQKKNTIKNKNTFGYEEYFFNSKKEAIEKGNYPKRKINNWAKAYEDNHLTIIGLDDDEG
jgi:hypothetical protein